MTRPNIVLVAVAAIVFAAIASAPPADDKTRLEDIEQQLARAWSQHDRTFIESVLAPEWSVTQANGEAISRAVVLGAFFGAVRP